MSSEKPHLTPRLIIHGGAGSLTRLNLPPTSPQYTAYTTSLSAILHSTYPLLLSHHTALDAATHAVCMLEDNPLFNAGKGAVFTTAGTNELEASVMVTGGTGAEKRGVGVGLLRRVKNPVLLARELLVRTEGREGRHNFLSGEMAERVAEKWGVEMVEEGYFWTEKRWRDHLKDLERSPEEERDPLEEYLPMGTVGAVAMDVWGNICVATSTGGLTNKLPGRIGDTPTLGAGFWAEEWAVERKSEVKSPLEGLLDACWNPKVNEEEAPSRRAVGLSGTGNGDYFLRLQACHSIACKAKYIPLSLDKAAAAVVGVGGEMQRAGSKGEGGIIGIELNGNTSKVTWELNCGGMFRGFIDDDGIAKVAVFADEEARIVNHSKENESTQAK